MRIISLFAFTLVSISLLSQSYQYAGAIGIDSSSHGLLYRGRVVRRYGASGVYRGLQERNIIKIVDKSPAKSTTKSPVKSTTKSPVKSTTKSPVKSTTKSPVKSTKSTKGSTKGAAKKSLPSSMLNTPSEDIKGPGTAPTPALATPTTSTQTPASAPKQTPKTKGKGSSVQGQDDTTDNTPHSSQDSQTSQDQEQNGSAGTPTVATGGISVQAIVGLTSVGGVFVLVGGLFAFSQRRKNKEITKSIVSNSSKAWEQQNSAYEVMEDEPKPLGSYDVIATYTPTLADELDIQPGDKVTILVEYDDGWVQGINETRGGIKGVFPRHCVDMNNATNKPKNINRSSSMGGFTSERYTEVDLS